MDLIHKRQKQKQNWGSQVERAVIRNSKSSLAGNQKNRKFAKYLATQDWWAAIRLTGYTSNANGL